MVAAQANDAIGIGLFLATPHSGSAVADLAQYLGFFVRTSVAVADLTAQNAWVRTLNTWFRNNFASLDLKTLIFFETMNTRGVRVVNEGSADPGIAPISPIPIDADHLSIAKPNKYSDALVGQTLRAFDDAVPSAKHRFRLEDINTAGNEAERKQGAFFRRQWLTRRHLLIGMAVVVAGITMVFVSRSSKPPKEAKAVLYTSGGPEPGIMEWRHRLEPPDPLATATLIKSAAAPVSVVTASFVIPNVLEGSLNFQKAEPYKQTVNGVPRPDGGGAHLIIMKFYQISNFDPSSIKSVDGISVKFTEGGQATELVADQIEPGCRIAGDPCPADQSFFYIYLTHDAKKKAFNVWNIQTAKFFEISFSFKGAIGSAVLVLEKDSAGEAAFSKALSDWGDYQQTRPD